ncbi:MAG: hypothetical protein JW834_04545 [Candidatus Diapherotrites archaeon]|nr:hypothetical protein [Candidatus Diapherotrites archaeon]
MALWASSTGFWLFVAGFMVGACLKTVPEYLAGVTILLGVLSESVAFHFVFLQFGLFAGMLVRAL